MTRMLDIMEELLEWRGYHYLRLDGSTAAADRGDLVQQFNDPGEGRCGDAVSVRMVWGAVSGKCEAALLLQSYLNQSPGESSTGCTVVRCNSKSLFRIQHPSHTTAMEGIARHL